MFLPPGATYVANFIPKYTITAIATYLSLHFLSTSFPHVVQLPTWAIVFISAVARPIVFISYKAMRPWVEARNAASNGARLPPWVPGSSSAVISRLSKMIKTGYPGEAFHEFTTEVGNTLLLELYSPNYLMLTLEPDHVKAILATQFENFEKGPRFFDQMKSLLGVGIFNADGDMWKFHRAMTRPFFTRERISDFDIYDRTCAKTLDLAKNRLDEGYSVDFQDLVGRFTLDSATEFLCGQNVGSLNAGIPYPSSASEKTPASFYRHPANRFLAAFGEGQSQAAVRSALGEDWPLIEFWRDTVAPLRAIVDDFTRPLLQEALAKREQNEKLSAADDNEGCLLDHLVKHTQDPTILKDEVMNLLVAGRDTTASLLSFALYVLTENPDIEKKLREEIFSKVGPKDRPTYEQMRDMKYTRAFFNEVLRLYPPVPVDTRTTSKPVILPSKTGLPFYIPANTNCIYSVMYMHRRKDLWGPDALVFDPMRFLDERVHKYLTPNPFIFCPFNAGPRICLGQQFAYHEATFFLVKLLQNFTGFELDSKENLPPNPEWRSSNDRRATDKICPSSHLTMFIKGGLWVKMQPYKEA